MTPFRDRSPVRIGIAGLITLALLTAAAFHIDDLPLIGNGDRYSAAFSEAGGLKPGDDVRIAGVKVGKVDEVALDHDHVRVSFRVKGDPALGTRTGAAIRVKTILGAKFLALRPEGPGNLPEDSTIPRSRTTPAYDVVEAFSDLTTTSEKVDKKRLAKAMDTLSSAFEDSPAEVRASVRGLAKLSRTVASRDEKLRELLRHAKGVSGVLADRSEDFTALVKDGDKLFKEISARRQVIHSLLKNAVRLSVQLSGLVRDNREQVGPALSRLHTVVRMLERNQKSLDRSAELLGPYARVFANTLGNGPWFDSYVQNLVAVPGQPRGGPDVKKPGGSR